MKFEQVWEGELDGRPAFTNWHCIFVLPTPKEAIVKKFDKPNEIQRVVDELRPKRLLPTKLLNRKMRENMRTVVLMHPSHPQEYQELYWSFAREKFPKAKPMLAGKVGANGERLLVFVENKKIMAVIMPLRWDGPFARVTH